jgi:hypothetical protein
MLKTANQRTASTSHGVGPSHIAPAFFSCEGLSDECCPVTVRLILIAPHPAPENCLNQLPMTAILIMLVL